MPALPGAEKKQEGFSGRPRSQGEANKRAINDSYEP